MTYLESKHLLFIFTKFHYEVTATAEGKVRSVVGRLDPSATMMEGPRPAPIPTKARQTRGLVSNADVNAIGKGSCVNIDVMPHPKRRYSRNDEENRKINDNIQMRR